MYIFTYVATDRFKDMRRMYRRRQEPMYRLFLYSRSLIEQTTWRETQSAQVNFPPK